MKWLRRDKAKALRGVRFCDETGEVYTTARCAEQRLETYKTNAWAAGARRTF